MVLLSGLDLIALNVLVLRTMPGLVQLLIKMIFILLSSAQTRVSVIVSLVLVTVSPVMKVLLVKELCALITVMIAVLAGPRSIWLPRSIEFTPHLGTL
jgi:hypothetical protein